MCNIDVHASCAPLNMFRIREDESSIVSLNLRPESSIN
jgi:hypothetical protein